MSRKKGVRSLYDLMRSDDPLSADAIALLHVHRREDKWVDYKEGLAQSSQEPMLELVKHVAAFANSQGGYLAFGFRDRTFEPVGVDAGELKVLGDAAALQTKIAGFIDPPKSDLLVRIDERDSRRFVFVYVPRTDAGTHVMAREGQFHTAKGESRCAFYPGQVYYRVSGQSLPIRAREFEEIVRRRIELGKSELFRDLRVLSRKPPNTVISFSNRDMPSVPGARAVALSGDASAERVAGVSFTVTPQSLEEEYLGAVALFRARPQNLPSRQLMYRLYADRASIAVQRSELEAALRFSLLVYTPSFYWSSLAGARTSGILRDSAPLARGHGLVQTLRVAAVHDRALYRELLAAHRQRLPRAAGAQIQAMEDMNWRRAFYLHPTVHAEIGGRQVAMSQRDAISDPVRAAALASQVADALTSASGNQRNRAALLALDFLLYAPRTQHTSKVLQPR